MIYDPETERHYLNEFHKKNSEAVMEFLSKQYPLSQEEMEAQTQAIKPSLKRKEIGQCHKTIAQRDKTTDSTGSHYIN